MKLKTLSVKLPNAAAAALDLRVVPQSPRDREKQFFPGNLLFSLTSICLINQVWRG